MIEEKVGIRGYITSTPGMGGEIKVVPEDFYVEEILDLKLGDGEYAILRVVKKNWDTMRLAKILANTLGISKKRVSFAGTKDKRSVSVQHFSVRGVRREEVERVRLKDVEIEFLGYSRKPIELGDLLGNVFRVVARGCEDGERFEGTLEELKEKGTPNFFGLQRFGTIRYITHEVGKLILQRRYEEAFWVYVAKPFEGESEDVRKIREELWNTRDAKLGLRELPKYLSYERSLLQKLREGKSELEALLSLPKNLKLMFVHAYQSYVFNRLLSDRIEEFGNLKEVQRGDWACYVTREKVKPTFADCSKVADNYNRVRRLIAERYAALALPLVGYDTELEGWNRRALEILAEDDLSPESFRSEFREFSSPGSWRAADMIVELSDLSFSDCRFEFYLPRGCYATVLLREFLKKELV
ncbi:MAG: tRNA pseudouridine(13) synthase TruD [Archaeoglobaceae archaeon]